jgi:hypothetical protein
MPVHGLVGYQVHPRLDDGLAASLGRQALLDRRKDLVVRKRECLDVEQCRKSPSIIASLS